MKDNKSLINIDDIDNIDNIDENTDFEEDIFDAFGDDFDDIEDVTDEIEIQSSNNEDIEDDFIENKNKKGVKKKRNDNLLYSTKIKIKDRLDERLYPKNKIVKKITNLETYEKIYDGMENTIRVAGSITSKNIKTCGKITKKTIKFLSIKQQKLSENIKTKLEGEVEVKIKTLQGLKGEVNVVDITIRKYWNERCIKNLDEVKLYNLIEKIKLNKDEPYFIIKIRSNDTIREIKIEKWAYDEILYKLNNL